MQRKDIYNCPICNNRMPGPFSLATHLHEIHGLAAAYFWEICPICQKKLGGDASSIHTSRKIADAHLPICTKRKLLLIQYGM